MAPFAVESILGGNPAYNAPADLDWAARQKSVAR